MLLKRFLPGLLVVLSAGCGTTKWSDTARTATEQMLISDAMDRAVSRVDFRALAGKEVYLDASPIQKSVDSEYLASTLRQQLLASGCILREKRDEARYVVEVRSGGIGTDRREVFFGVPSAKVPSVVPVPAGVPSSIPEINLANKTEQRAVAKIALFAYNRETGRPVWQSGVIPVESTAKDIWFLGAGPFQQGSIYQGTKFAGEDIDIPLVVPGEKAPERRNRLSVAQEAYFAEPVEQLADDAGQPDPAVGDPGKAGPAATPSKVVPASHAEPSPSPTPKPAAPKLDGNPRKPAAEKTATDNPPSDRPPSEPPKADKADADPRKQDAATSDAGKEGAAGQDGPGKTASEQSVPKAPAPPASQPELEGIAPMELPPIDRARPIPLPHGG